MITCLSIGHYGRFGNQIFQYALLKAVSLKNNYEIVLPEENCFQFIESCNFNPVINKNDIYKLDLYDCFEIKEKVKPKQEILQNIRYVFNESVFGHNPEVFKMPDSTNFHGYFQSANYFYDYEEEIKKSLKFKEKINNIVDLYLSDLKKLKNVESITTVHIRRGDAIPQEGQYQVFLTKEYYQKLFDDLRDKNNVFLVISDDIEWCKQNFQRDDILFSSMGIISQQVDIPEHLLDFCLLSKGEQIIMANSTFSWWAAWLSTAEVYCPDKWWGPIYQHFGEEGLRHKNWRNVNVK